MAMALRAGVAVADVEFVQFHPTALHHPEMPRPLLSEALRGHGALLRDARRRALRRRAAAPRRGGPGHHPAHVRPAASTTCWLDATGLEAFDDRFPTIAAALARVGTRPGRDWLPIAPAAHHLSGGVVTDLDGAASIPGLWAAGEAACSGVHGANRLASNSLLEGMVFGARVVEAIESGRDAARPTGAMRAVLDSRRDVPAAADPTVDAARIGGRPAERWRPLRAPMPPAPTVGETAANQVAAQARADRLTLQRAMTEGAGVLRDADSLAATSAVVSRLAGTVPQGETDPAVCELANLLELAQGLLASATQRTESRGSHTRADFLDTDPTFRCRIVLDASRPRLAATVGSTEAAR